MQFLSQQFQLQNCIKMHVNDFLKLMADRTKYNVMFYCRDQPGWVGWVGSGLVGLVQESTVFGWFS